MRARSSAGVGQKEVYRQQEARSGAVSLYRRKEVHQEGKA
ncbi:thiosulfate reductase electron transport protein PhsB [Salmonella sp. NCTC 11881]|nr:thiosulfate reductase electron transport protein PhsB [Salmonella sp. NCTC 11881]